MNNDKENRRIIKQNYQTLIDLGIPSYILDNQRKWLFFLQEGWDGENNWYYFK